MFNFIFKPLEKLLFGRTTECDYGFNTRASTLKIPGVQGQKELAFTYRVDDGVLPTLLLKIEDLEDRLRELESQKKTES